MRILISSQSYYPGTNGQAVFSIHLAEGLAENGHKVLVLFPSERTGPYTSHRNNVTIHGVSALHLEMIHPATYWTVLPDPEVHRIIDIFRPQLIHVQDHFPLSESVIRYARKLGIPAVGTNHFLPQNLSHHITQIPAGQTYINHFLWKHMLSVYNHLDAVTTPTETAAEILTSQGIRAPVFAITCGVDVHTFRPRPNHDKAAFRLRYGLPERSIVLLYVGRLEQEKRLDTLIKAVAWLNRDDLRIVLAGSGNYRPELDELTQKLGIADKVVIPGYIQTDELPLLYNSADLFCMPGTEELQSIATLEAMASGLPVIAANARALPELVAPGINGTLFRPFSWESIARELAGLLENRASWGVYGEVSVLRAQAHSLKNSNRLYNELYRSFLPHRYVAAARSGFLDRSGSKKMGSSF